MYMMNLSSFIYMGARAALIKNFGARTASSNTELRGYLSTMASIARKIHSQPFTVFVEGNIGSGKTTFLKHFELVGDIATFAEPVNQWQNVRGKNLLDLMYKDPSRWGITFQTYVQLTMLKLHTEPVEFSGKMMERSIHSARYCFVENLHKGGLMPEPDFIVLDEWFKWITKNHNVSGNLIVYLRTTPEVVHERIRARARVEESCVPLEYLKQLHELHENWLYHQSSFHLPAPVLVIDANQDLCSMRNELLACESKIREEMSKFVPEPSSPSKITIPPKRTQSLVS